MDSNNSKLITVNNEQFRWSAYMEWADLFFVAELADSPKNKIEVLIEIEDRDDIKKILMNKPWNFEFFTESVVGGIILEAVEKGWEPNEGKSMIFVYGSNGNLNQKSTI